MPFIDLSDSGWDLFFPDTCTILQPTNATSDLGEQRTTWAPLAGHAGLGAALEFKGGFVVSKGTATATSTHTIHLRGCFPGIATGFKASINGQTFFILAPGSDSQHVKTLLHVERVI